MARPRKFDEAAVMEAVRETFWKTGYAATSLDDLMAATGLGKGSLYGAFGDKRQLFARVFEDYCADSIRNFRAALEGDDAGALPRLRAYFDANVTSMVQDTTQRGCLVAKATAELANCDPAIADRALATYQALGDLFVANLVQAQQYGALKADTIPEQAGLLLLAVFRGLEALGKAGADETTLRRIVDTTFSLL
jgi:TetR/AcrR family transcriptional regulator, transcriptional repressor for nem operon